MTLNNRVFSLPSSHLLRFHCKSMRNLLFVRFDADLLLVLQAVMADPSKGRGRGLALLQALKAHMKESPPSSQEPTPEVTPGPSVASSTVSCTY